MEVTAVRIKLVNLNEPRGLKGFCVVEFDRELVVTDLKIIDGRRGCFVAMPSRKLTVHCKSCRVKVEVTDNFCHGCGHKVEVDLSSPEVQERKYADIVFPICPEARAKIHKAVLDAYQDEVARARAMTPPG